MEGSRQSPRSSREQITLSTIEGIDDFSQRLSLSRATTSTVTTDYRRPPESPSNAFGSTASPGSCASTLSTAVVGGNNPLPLVSTTSVGHSEAAGSDAGKVTVGAADQPDAPLPNHYDAVIFHDVRDLERAELFRGRLLNVLGPAGEGLRLSVFGCEADVGRSYYEQLEDTVRRSTYLMLFVTRNLCDDRVVGALLRDQLLSEMLENREKRWCLIPVWTEPEEEYAKPLALRPLVGIAEKSMSDKLRRESVVRMFTDKRSWRVLREQTERERHKKEDEQKLQKLKYDEEERQHRERLQQLDEDHQRELRHAQRQAELARLLEKNAHARREEENSAAVGNQLMQMQIIQQNARHLCDQRILEEWQRDAEEQAHAMAGCPITGGAPSVLRPRGGNAPPVSDGHGGLWVSAATPDSRAYVAVANGSGLPTYSITVPQLPGNSGSPASSPLTVTAARAAPGARNRASERQLLPPPWRSCTPEETLRQAHDLLRQLHLKCPQTPPSVDPKPPPYSELFSSPADVLPSHNLTGAPPSGRNASSVTGISAIRIQEKKPQPLPDSAPMKSTPVAAVAQETDGKNRAAATPWPTPVLDDVVSKVEDIRKNQQALLRDCAEQRRLMSSSSLPERQPAASAFSSSSYEQLRSEGRSAGLPGSYDRPRLSERPLAPVAELPSYRYPSVSNSGVFDAPGWQGYSRAVQPHDASQSFVVSDTYTSSMQQPLMAPQLQGAPAAGYVPVDPQHQPPLPQGYVALRVEEFAALSAVLRQLQSPSGNVHWPSTGVPLQQLASPPCGLPMSHTGTERLPQSQSMPAYIGDVAGNAYGVDPRFRLGQQQMPYSGSNPVLAPDTRLDHHFASRFPSHVDFASVPGRATLHQDAASPRVPDHLHAHRQSSSQCMPVSTQCAGTSSRHRVLTGSQPSSWATTERDFSSIGSSHYPASRGFCDAPLGTGSSSASEGAGSYSSGPSSVGTGSEGSGGSASSLDSGHGPAATALRSGRISFSSAGGPGNIPLTVLEQWDSAHSADMQPLTLHPTH